MNPTKKITVFEHERLTTSNPGFSVRHLDALLKLNEFNKYSYFDAIPNGVKFKQFVGIIQVDDLTIEILPKVDKDDSKTDWRDILLQMLKACGKVKASSAGDANVKRQNLNLLEVYFNTFLREIESLQRRGLIKQYSRETKNVKALKGKLEFAQNINKNLIHKERFFTTHQVYNMDHKIHQILVCALDIVESFSKGSYLYDRCKRIQISLPKISKVRINKSFLNRVHINRKSKPYTNALDLARLIILNYSPDISSGRERMISLLFDMNRLWEEFIYIKVKNTLKESDFIVDNKQTKGFIGYNYLKPDLVIYHKNDPTQTYVLDTKWKRPKNRSSSINDLRQMYTYCRFWKATKAILLYPGDHFDSGFKQFKTVDHIEYESEIEKVNHRCKSGYVSVVDSDGRLSEDIGDRVFELIN